MSEDTQAVDGAGYRQVHAVDLIEHALAAAQRWPFVTLGEDLVFRLVGAKYVGFMLNSADRYSRHAQLPISCYAPNSSKASIAPRS